MERFLNEEIVRKSEERARRDTAVMVGAGILTLGLFVALCLMTRTGNARTMLFIAMGGTVAAGWGMLAWWMFRAEPARAEARHLKGLAAGQEEIREGRFFLENGEFRIPQSVRVNKVRLETGEETVRLNLNAGLRNRMPGDGARVRVETVRKFITGIEVLEEGTGQKTRPGGRGKRIRRGLGRWIPAAVIWGLFAVMVTGFVFNQITDTDPGHKITVFADCEVKNGAVLAERLEKALEGAVRMVKVHPFSYAMLNSASLRTADVYIVPDSRREEYREWLGDGEGILFHDPENGKTAGGETFILSPEIYRVYIGAQSAHLEDGLARKTAEILTETEGRP